MSPTKRWREYLIAGLNIQVVDDELVVSLPQSSYSVTYYKPPKSSGLLTKNISRNDDPQIEIKLSEFLAGAWRAANDSARVEVDRVGRLLPDEGQLGRHNHLADWPEREPSKLHMR